MALVPDGCADLADGVDEVHAQHPLVDGQLGLSRKVVDVLDERAEDESLAISGLGANGVDDMFGEVGVESIGGLAGGGHDCDLGMKREEEERN